MEVNPQRYSLLAGLGLDIYFASGVIISPRIMLGNLCSREPPAAKHCFGQSLPWQQEPPSRAQNAALQNAALQNAALQTTQVVANQRDGPDTGDSHLLSSATVPRPSRNQQFHAPSPGPVSEVSGALPTGPQDRVYYNARWPCVKTIHQRPFVCGCCGTRCIQKPAKNRL